MMMKNLNNLTKAVKKAANWSIALPLLVLAGAAIAETTTSSATTGLNVNCTAANASSATYTTTQIETSLAKLIALVNGPIAKSLAVLAVIGFGVAALTGKVEWSRAMIVVLGVGVVFSAGTFVNMFCST